LARTAWLLSEHAGQIRGMLAAYAESREPVSGFFLEQIGIARITIRETIDELRTMRDLRGLAPHLREVMAVVEDTLGQRFDGVVDEMLQAALTGDYPLDGAAWYETTTAQIDTIVALSDAAAMHAAGQLEGLAARNRLLAAAFVVFLLLAGYLASLSLR